MDASTELPPVLRRRIAERLESGDFPARHETALRIGFLPLLEDWTGCLALGPDGQVTGGCPVVAVVAEADREALGQARPGTRIRFRHARTGG